MAFITEDFMLHGETAKALYHEHAKNMPIIDYHNHLDPKKIYEDPCYDNIAQVWLEGDHYKWRAMRAMGFPETVISGGGDDFERFQAWAQTVENCIGNPLYHWTHLELKRYFNVDKVLNKKNAAYIWDACNEKLRSREFSVRNLLRMQQVKMLCTTDDPADDLIWHKKLKAEGFDIHVLPSFRPGRALSIEAEDFSEYAHLLSEKTHENVSHVDGLLKALSSRLDDFAAAGCRVSDHSLDTDFYIPADEAQADAIYQKGMEGRPVSPAEAAMYRGYLLTALGREYHKRDLVMQLHIGALRNTSSRMFARLGADTGFDSMGDFSYAASLAGLMDAMDRTDELPKMVLYGLNPQDMDMLAAMAGNFQGNDRGIRGKIQLGSAWWFGDHKDGILRQLKALSSNGLLPVFIGMLTDSRSFLSFPRHEYFRRILCDFTGNLVDLGEYPKDMEFLGEMTENICYYNCRAFLTASRS